MSKEKPTDYAPNKKAYLIKEIKKALINDEITLKQAKIKYMSIDKNFTNKNIDKNYKNISDLKKNILKLLSQGKITQEEAKAKIEFIEILIQKLWTIPLILTIYWVILILMLEVFQFFIQYLLIIRYPLIIQYP